MTGNQMNRKYGLKMQKEIQVGLEKKARNKHSEARQKIDITQKPLA